ncbi:unnamed protein product [Prorocentrum cordatum]|uniref:RNA-directed RNA polymerase n=1 Tax=Prorocentrum cordatum TaxID=2364126 RepID=A0ABN9UGK8_9DINO|nr:unnamed protein product [Polarella glacialis]
MPDKTSPRFEASLPERHFDGLRLSSRRTLSLVQTLYFVDPSRARFRSLLTSLTNRHVNVKLRLKLFNATVTPTLVYGLETCALDQKELDHLDITQRKMLRRIVGWVFDDSDSWEDAGRRMKQRLESARRLHYIADWSSVVSKRKKHLLSRCLN